MLKIFTIGVFVYNFKVTTSYYECENITCTTYSAQLAFKGGSNPDNF